MAARRSRGEGGVHFSESRQRWIATAQVGFLPNGKRIVKTGTGKAKTEAKAKLKELLRNREDGIQAIVRATVAAAVADWLEFGLSGRSDKTVTTCRVLAEKHIIPDLGARKLHQLTAQDVDQWLKGKSSDLARSTLQRACFRSCGAPGPGRWLAAGSAAMSHSTARCHMAGPVARQGLCPSIRRRLF